MLYQPASPNRARQVARRVLGVLAAVASALAGISADRRYLDGMRDSELEDLNIRRMSNGGYRPFE